MQDIFFTQPDWQLFTNINTLPQQAGVAKYLLPQLVAKELTDNALDADRKVFINQEVGENFQDTFSIKNLGNPFPGSDEEIADFFSIRRPLTSSKRFRLPSRGALGNGLRVVIATVYCLGGELSIATNGQKLKLIPQDDGTTLAEKIADFDEEGTEIQVSLPHNIFANQTLEWANLALKINQGESYTGKTHPQWYDSDSFHNLCLSTPVKILVADFLRYFEGLKNNQIKEMAQTFSNRPISEFNREESDKLLGHLRSLVPEFKIKKLGAVGKLDFFSAHQLLQSEFSLKTTKGNFDAQIPIVIEAFAGAQSEYPNQFFVNKTPITGEVNISYFDKKLLLFGCGLNRTVETKLKQNPKIWLNIITPYMPIVSNGKEPDLSVLEDAIAETIQKVSNQLARQRKQSQALLNVSLEKLPSQKQVVLENLEAGIAKASGEGQYRYSLRQLYYALRPFVIEYTGKELKYANFNNIITDYEHETGRDLEGIYRDERGILLHPHTHYEVRLGTRTVEKYTRPLFNFNKILYSEKEGFFEILKDAGFCEKHDCALLTSKGFASRAARDVIDMLAETEEELIFFCIHDADISGTLIYETLQGATKARPKRKVKIINLGLEPWEGMAMGLEVESLEKKSRKNPAPYVKAYDEQSTDKTPFEFNNQYLETTWAEWLKSYRIELNAMDTPTFIQWLDEKVSTYDNGKVVPHERYLKQEAQQNLESNLKSRLREEILTQLNVEERVLKELENLLSNIEQKIQATTFEENVRQDLSEEPVQSWSDSFQSILQEILKGIKT